MIAALAIPLALGETWWGVLGGLIPIIGLTMIGIVIWRAAQPPEDQKDPGDRDDEQPPT
jgi:hypothetical protein